MSWLPESLLEMHFHRAIIKEYEKRYGKKVLRLLKPSPQKEVWVGFDQGWTKSTLTEQELFNQLKNAISTKKASVPNLYLGEFLQFKVVQRITRKSKKMPTGFTTPYFRSELSLKPNKQTGISQHEALCRLSKVKGSSVYYACPMIFDQDQLWDKPDLKMLRFVDIKTAPKGWITNESHHITFQDPMTSKPMWCSDPVPGRAFSHEELWERNNQRNLLTGNQTISLIQGVSEIVLPRPSDDTEREDLLVREILIEDESSSEVHYLSESRYLPESMSIYEFEG